MKPHQVWTNKIVVMFCDRHYSLVFVYFPVFSLIYQYHNTVRNQKKINWTSGFVFHWTISYPTVTYDVYKLCTLDTYGRTCFQHLNLSWWNTNHTWPANCWWLNFIVSKIDWIHPFLSRVRKFFCQDSDCYFQLIPLVRLR